MIQNLPEREALRRRRISEANKGKTPWNLGRKHSEGALAPPYLLTRIHGARLTGTRAADAGRHSVFREAPASLSLLPEDSRFALPAARGF